jgi:hypothetical protein
MSKDIPLFRTNPESVKIPDFPDVQGVCEGFKYWAYQKIPDEPIPRIGVICVAESWFGSVFPPVFYSDKWAWEPSHPRWVQNKDIYQHFKHYDYLIEPPLVDVEEEFAGFDFDEFITGPFPTVDDFFGDTNF